jgi:hypothetical protein
VRARAAAALAAVALPLCALLSAAPAPAEEPAEPGHSLGLRTSLKGSLLVSRSPRDPLVSLERDAVISFWRLRLEPEARLGPSVTAAAAYEHRLHVFSTSAVLTRLSVLGSESRAFYRLWPLDWAVSSSAGHSWRHQIDRAYLGVHLPRVDLTLGRQAVGWGRGVMFGAVDMFAPFAPFEADREWRGGVDAVRADVKLTGRASAEVLGVFGEDVDASAFAGRLRGYAGKVDLEVVAGWRCRDLFAGLTSSAAVGNAAVHAELALFRAPEPLPATPERRTAVKTVVGGSYRFALGNGLLVYAEYHYSGFGAADESDIPTLLADPAFGVRYLRGDTQILGRHALGVLASLEVSPDLALTGQWLQSALDGSGLLAPSATLTLGDQVSVLATLYVPYGRGPSGGTPRTEYGAASRSVFVQVRLYK